MGIPEEEASMQLFEKPGPVHACAVEHPQFGSSYISSQVAHLRTPPCRTKPYEPYTDRSKTLHRAARPCD